MNFKDVRGLEITGFWVRKPYVENFNIQDIGVHLPEQFMPSRDSATLLLLNFTISGDVGFFVSCREKDECGNTKRSWWVKRKYSVSKKIEDVPIKIQASPRFWRLRRLEEYIKENFAAIQILKNAAKKMDDLFGMAPTEICKETQNQ